MAFLFLVFDFGAVTRTGPAGDVIVSGWLAAGGSKAAKRKKLQSSLSEKDLEAKQDTPRTNLLPKIFKRTFKRKADIEDQGQNRRRRRRSWDWLKSSSRAESA